MEKHVIVSKKPTLDEILFAVQDLSQERYQHLDRWIGTYTVVNSDHLCEIIDRVLEAGEKMYPYHRLLYYTFLFTRHPLFKDLPADTNREVTDYIITCFHFTEEGVTPQCKEECINKHTLLQQAKASQNRAPALESKIEKEFALDNYVKILKDMQKSFPGGDKEFCWTCHSWFGEDNAPPSYQDTGSGVCDDCWTQQLDYEAGL